MNARPLTADKPLSVRAAWGVALLIAACVFAAVAPTLPWPRFTNGSENLVTQTALEMRHGGPALLPELMGEPRVKKPPLVAWVTAASIRPSTVARLDDSAGTDAAYRALAFEVRWPALLAGCVMVLATFEFARVWAGPGVAVASATAVATNYLFLKYLRSGTTDAHLAAWVMVANAGLAHGLLRGRWWPALTVGGAAVGVAFLCKGPVALVQTVLPAGVTAAVLHVRRSDGGTTAARRRLPWAAAGAGAAIFASIAVPWFAYVWLNVPGVATTWRTEVGREGATHLDAGNPLLYLALGPLTAPWLVFGVVGMGLLWQRRRDRTAWTAAVFAAVPLLVMVLFRDRKERYMLPMIGPAAAVCGYGAAAWAKSWATRRTRTDGVVLAVHAAVVVGLAGTLLVLGATTLRRTGGGPWYPPAVVAGAGVGLATVVAFVGVGLRRGRGWTLVAGTFVTMLGVAALWFHGYGDANRSLKPLADAIRAEAPGAAVYDWLPRGRADEQIAVYLNRTILRADPRTLPPADRPVVMIARQARRDPPPDLPPDWRLLATAKEGGATWFAYVRR